MQVGFIGLGKMGGNMTLKLLEGGHEVVAWNRSTQPVKELKFKIQNSKFKIANQNLKVAKTIEELVESLKKPRIVWSMLPAGEATQTILDEVSKHVQPGDIVIDGGNAHYKDSERRYKEFKDKGIKFLGIGVSGGIIAATDGYPLMVGGDKSAYEYIRPILESLAMPKGGYEYFGEGGAGHFVKMIHNGIEYGYMQAIGEGFDVLEHAQYKLNLPAVAKLWAKNSLVSGFMMDRTVEVLEKDPKLENIVGVINASGEAQWTIDTAKELGVPVEIIARSLDYRKRSKTDLAVQNSFTAKLIASLRNAFGRHEVKKK